MPHRRLLLAILPAALALAGIAAFPADAARLLTAQAPAAAGLDNAERQAVAEALVDALRGIRIYDNGAVEELSSGDLSDPDGMPPGLMDYVGRAKQLPPGLQQLVIDAVELRLPRRRAQVAGLSLILRDAVDGTIVGTVADVLALRRSLGLRS